MRSPPGARPRSPPAARARRARRASPRLRGPRARARRRGRRSTPGTGPPPSRAVRSQALQGDLVRLDQRVGDQLLAHALDLGTGGGRVAVLELELDKPPYARAGDRKAELAQRAPDRLALGIEDPRLRPNEHRRLHRSTTSGSARQSSNRISVRRSNTSTYRARVPATTSSGSSGPGYVLSQPSEAA